MNSMAAPSSPKRPKVGHWPEGVIQEILARLPIKSILRFKSTCKNWYSLIRSRSFIQFHRRLRVGEDDDHRHHLFFSCNRGPRNPYKKNALYEISCFSPSSPSSSSTTPLFDLRTLHKAVVEDGLIELIRSVKKCFVTNRKGESGIHSLGPLSNGIICVISEVYLKRIRDSECASLCKIAFCNPATREFKFVGYSPLIRVCAGARLSDYGHYYGFASIYKAADDSTLLVADDYKMVAIQQHKNQSFKALVYSLRRHTWDLICDSDNLDRYSLAGLVNNEEGKVEFPEITQDLYWLPAQALLNGCCHWMARNPNKNLHSSVVLQFDMANEVFGLIAGPPDPYYNLLGYRVKRGVFVLNDHHLAVVIVVHRLVPEVSVDRIDVWMMTEYGVEASWTKIRSCEITLHGHIERLLGISFSKHHHHGDTIERIFFQLDSGNFMSCGPSGLETHTTFDRYWVCWKPLGFSAYVETLEPLELDTSTEADVETLNQEGSDEDTSF